VPHNRKSLVAELRALGLGPGQAAMMHASARAVGPVIGGPDEIHLAAEAAIQPGGTLTMFVGCQDGFDDVGRGVLSPEQESEILRHQPSFDFQHARAARGFGILAEFFRSYPGTLCSQSICGRMAARGARAAWLMAEQPWNYGFGRGSPLDKLCQIGGKILLLGSQRAEVTLLHYAEHIAPIAGKRVAQYKVPVLQGGKRVWIDCEEFDTSGRGVHARWPENAFEIIVSDFIDKNRGTSLANVGIVGAADSALLDAASLLDHAIAMMQAWAADGDCADTAEKLE
jgi:aminoglycoside 3-N-acetyltransferase